MPRTTTNTMDLYDYLLDQTDLDWDKLLTPYKNQLPSHFSVWLANKFGDLFIIFEDKSIHHLNALTGAIQQIASDKDEFLAILAEHADDLLYAHLVNQATAKGLALTTGQCYSFKVPLVLSGELSIDNIQITDLATAYSFISDIAAKIKGLPEGMPINLSLADELPH